MPRLIDADALIENIKRVYCTGCNDYGGVRCRACGTGDAIEMIDDAPDFDAEPVRHGRWEGKRWSYSCSICGGLSPEDGGVKTNYCPRLRREDGFGGAG